MANRLQRDQILIRALDMVDSSTLDDKDRPSGTIASTALSITWLQDAIDAFYHEFPWAANITRNASFQLTTAAQSPAVYNVPASFLWDMRNGIVLTTGTMKRLLRKPLQEVLSMAVGNQTAGTPEIYTVVHKTVMVHPRPDVTYDTVFWHYEFPAVLGPTDVPTFPTDLVLIDYVRLRGLEWIRALQPGSAQGYIREEIKNLREGALGREPESTEMPNDPVLTIKQAGGKTQLNRASGSQAPRGTTAVGV